MKKIVQLLSFLVLTVAAVAGPTFDLYMDIQQPYREFTLNKIGQGSTPTIRLYMLDDGVPWTNFPSSHTAYWAYSPYATPTGLVFTENTGMDTNAGYMEFLVPASNITQAVTSRWSQFVVESALRS